MLRFRELVDPLGLFGRFLTRRGSLVPGFGIVGLGESGRSQGASSGGEKKERRAQPAGNAERTMEHGAT
jgi:hypothetical protein